MDLSASGKQCICNWDSSRTEISVLTFCHFASDGRRCGEHCGLNSAVFLNIPVTDAFSIESIEGTGFVSPRLSPFFSRMRKETNEKKQKESKRSEERDGREGERLYRFQNLDMFTSRGEDACVCCKRRVVGREEFRQLRGCPERETGGEEAAYRVGEWERESATTPLKKYSVEGANRSANGLSGGHFLAQVVAHTAWYGGWAVGRLGGWAVGGVGVIR